MVNVPIAAIGAHGLVLVLLAVHVVYYRVTLGNKPDTTGALERAAQSQRNAAEFIPWLCVSFLYYVVQPGARTGITDLLIIGATLFRLSAAVGLIFTSKGKINPGRPVGAIGTFATMGALAAQILYDGLTRKY